MAHTTFPVEVLTPEGEVFKDDVEMVSTKTTLGSIGILANHEPLLATLEPTELRLYRSESEIVTFAQGEGYMQVGDNRVLILVQDAVDTGALDASDLRERLQRAQGTFDSAEVDSEVARQAEREVRRLEAFLKIAEAG
jgi:F-type H+-transporting ATPase subunit epsilon